MIKKTNARHGDFYIFEKDMFISRCLDLYGEWSEAEMVIYNTFIKKEHIVIEVGSHIGSFTVPIARLAKSVFAFEPQRTVFQVLNTNLITNGIHNVYSYMHAVGSEDKHLWLKEVDYEAGTTEQGFNSGGVHLKQINTEHNGYPCKQITLDSFIPKEATIGFIKVDAEEMEIDVLRGADGLIKAHKPILYLESHMSNTELPEYVEKLGYKVFEHIPMNFNPNNYKNNQTRVLAFDKNVEHMHDYMLLCIPKETDFKTNLKQIK
jgi:FkbM family methyltransferase